MNARIVLILGFAFISSCGGGGGGGGDGGAPAVLSRFLYVNAFGPPNTVRTDIYGFAVYTSGELSVVPGSPAPAQDQGGGPIAISRDSKLLYTSNIYQLVAFPINADGSLNAASSSFSTPDTPVGLVAHPIADFLYASSGSGVLSVFTINSETGALNLTSSVSLRNVTGNPIEVGTSAVITPNGRYLYQNDVMTSVVSSAGVFQIAGFSIDSATGALTPVPGSPVLSNTPSIALPPSSPMAIDPTGKFLYASYQFAPLNGGPDGGVAAFSIDPASGELTTVPGSPFSVGFSGSIAIDASGKFLIVGLSPEGRGPGNCLAVLSIDPGTGALTPVPGSPFGYVQVCAGIAADPSAPFVYASGMVSANTFPPSVLVLSIDPGTGALAPVTQTAIPDSTKVGVGLIALTH